MERMDLTLRGAEQLNPSVPEMVESWASVMEIHRRLSALSLLGYGHIIYDSYIVVIILVFYT